MSYVYFKIVIEGIIGDGFLSDIAIDDTSFTAGCLPYNMPLPSYAPPTTTTVGTPNPCGDKYKCETNPYTCILQSQVITDIGDEQESKG